LHDSFGDHVGVLLFLARVLQKFLSYSLSMDAGGHVVMALVAQDANDLCSERLVQDSDHSLAVCLVGISNCAVLDVLPGSPADFFNIRYKWPAFVGLRRLWTHDFLFSSF
jgi:hypothetical protein